MIDEKNIRESFKKAKNDIVDLNTEISQIKGILEEIKTKIFRHSEFFILIVFGSYAEGKASESSDLDIALIVESEISKKEIIPFLETIKRRELIKLDYHAFTRGNFMEMLEIDEENLGKQIYRKNIIYYGLISYSNMIKDVKHGKIS